MGYPGGAVLEKMARVGDINKFKLPIPLIGQEKRQIFSYSGLKTSFYRLLDASKKSDASFRSKQNIYDLSASYQDVAFKHLLRVIDFCIAKNSDNITDFLFGGGVAANIELRKRLRSLGEKFGFKLHIPYTMRVCGDNAAMIGITAYLKLHMENLDINNFRNYNNIDRDPRLKIS